MTTWRVVRWHLSLPEAALLAALVLLLLPSEATVAVGRWVHQARRSRRPRTHRG